MTPQLYFYSHDDEGLELLERLVGLVRQYEQSPLGLPEGWWCEVIYSGRNRLYRVGGPEGEDYVVKSFGRIAWLRRLYYSITNQSKAKRSLLNALELIQLEVGTAQPLGYVEERSAMGILGDSYYVCRYIAGRVDLQPEMYGYSAPEGFYEALGGFIASLHEAGIEHIDLSPGNILYARGEEEEEPYRFYLVDLNRMHFYPYALSGRKAYRGLSKLSSSLSVSTQLAHYYALARGLERREVIRAVNEASDRFFAARHPKLSLRHARRNLGIPLLGFIRLYIHYRLVRRLRLSLGSQSPLAQRLKRWEEDCYSRYLAEEDIRRVLQRRYGYRRRFFTPEIP